MRVPGKEVNGFIEMGSNEFNNENNLTKDKTMNLNTEVKKTDVAATDQDNNILADNTQTSLRKDTEMKDLLMEDNGGRQTLVSIDWDFFPWNGLKSKKHHTFNLNGQKAGYWQLFDWGHNERMRSDFLEIMWKERKEHWMSLGLNFENEFNIRTDRGCTNPKTFVKTLKKKLNIAEPDVHHSDSHSFAYFVARNCHEYNIQPIRVIHFGAHHDLGYHDDRVYKEIEEGILDCGSWLFHAINNGYVDEVDLVYPNWRGKGEWNDWKDETHIQSIANKINVYTWNEWKVLPDTALVENIIIARSSHWTPPWLDIQFSQFIDLFDPIDTYCAKCYYGFQDYHDSCIPREWDFNSICGVREPENELVAPSDTNYNSASGF